MLWHKGEPLVAKLAFLAKCALPVAMAASIIYSPPNYDSSKKDKSPK